MRKSSLTIGENIWCERRNTQKKARSHKITPHEREHVHGVCHIFTLRLLLCFVATAAALSSWFHAKSSLSCDIIIFTAVCVCVCVCGSSSHARQHFSTWLMGKRENRKAMRKKKILPHFCFLLLFPSYFSFHLIYSVLLWKAAAAAAEGGMDGKSFFLSLVCLLLSVCLFAYDLFKGIIQLFFLLLFLLNAHFTLVRSSHCSIYLYTHTFSFFSIRFLLFFLNGAYVQIESSF